MQDSCSSTSQPAQAARAVLPVSSVCSWFTRGMFRPAVLVPAAVWLLVSGCSSVPLHTTDAPYGRTSPAQKTGRTGKMEVPAAKMYVVQKGDTLYGIALNNGLDYRELAAWNGITDPRTLVIGQQLVLAAPGSRQSAEPETSSGGPVLYSVTGPKDAPVTSATPGTETTRQIAGSDRLKTGPKAFKLPYSEQAVAQIKAASLAVPAAMPDPVRAEPVKNESVKNEAGAETNREAETASPAETAADGEAAADATAWEWPATGSVQGGLSEGAKGIGIEGKMGQPVLAAAAGKVVYSGSGLRGYGKLVIIKHNAVYLSAYAHNSKLLAREGQSVTRGQKIAEMGNTDSNLVKLHFEIRKYGKPVDPLAYLPKIPK